MQMNTSWVLCLMDGYENIKKKKKKKTGRKWEEYEIFYRPWNMYWYVLLIGLEFWKYLSLSFWIKLLGC